LLGTLSQEELTEVSMRIDLQSLHTLLAHATEPVRSRVLAALPKSLRDRLAMTRSKTRETDEDTDPSLMKARAQLVNAYRVSRSEVVL
jgi:hypothetical protein